ncbi:hypothetical protein [Actinomadura coerulea]|uniref:hypothetical protein n=1 Tax=Actinomadura coerulea TaxID=46159 RepID=UPI0034260A2F
MITNGGFTRSARRNAEQFRIALLDQAKLERRATGGVSRPELLGLGTVRGRRHQLRFRHAPASAGPSGAGPTGADDRGASKTSSHLASRRWQMRVAAMATKARKCSGLRS